eukprot:m.26161 g.26161  ORF g.26161 m.26161 type:complete len:321 (+) comp11666_c0_seq1:27-989(+)
MVSLWLHCWDLKLIVLGFLVHRTSGTIIGTAVIPHGDFAYDCTLIHCVNGSQQVHDASVSIGHWVAELKPDTVVITTPHGLASTNDYLWYMNHNGSGFALLGQDLHNGSAQEYKVPFSTQIDVDLSQQLLDSTYNMPHNNVSGLSSFADSEPVALRWGEVIPLSFLGNSVNNTNPVTKVAVMSVPTRRYTQDVAMIPELQQLGRTYAQLLHNSTRRVVVLVSSDLAHTHLASGPYGYSPTAEPFDKAIGKWAETLESKYLVDTAAQLVDRALSCGFTGLVLLDALLQQLRSDGLAVHASMLALEHPTYYGMMVAGFNISH